jgi:hypothetical protein
MNRMKSSVILACLLCLFYVIVATVRLLIWFFVQRGSAADLGFVEAFGWNWLIPVFFSVLATIIIARQPQNRVGWLLMLPLVTALGVPGTILATPPTVLTPGWWLLLWYNGWSWIPGIFAIFLIPLYFPTGRPPSPRWNWVNWLALGMALFFILFIPFLDNIGPTNYDWTLPNPIGFIPSEVANGSFLIIWGIGLMTILLASLASLFVRYRRAQVVERQQIKWLLYAVGLFAIVYPTSYALGSKERDFVSGWAEGVFIASILAIGVAIAIAILRYRLFDIDIVIRKTLVYSVLTGLLALVYFGTVLLLEAFLGRALPGSSALVIVLSTLLIAALFAPLRRRVQNIIDRRFYRRKYDAEKVLAAFANYSRQETDPDRLAAELIRVVQDTMQPQGTALWLKPAVLNKRRPDNPPS